MSIYSLEIIEAEARAAALKNSNIDTVCRFPYSSPEGQAYRAAFNKARDAIDALTNATAIADIVANLDQFEAVA